MQARGDTEENRAAFRTCLITNGNDVPMTFARPEHIENGFGLSRSSFTGGLLLFWFVNLDCLNETFAFRERTLRQREKSDSVNGEALQRTAQRFKTLASDCDKTVLEVDMKGLSTGIPDKFGMLEIPVWEQMNLTRLFYTQALSGGIRAPAGQIL
jgi:hypothetical protein